MKIKKENIGAIIQLAYDSEINLAIGYCWDGGFSYTLTPEFYLENVKINQSTGERNIEDFFTILIADILENYPTSKFAKEIDTII